MSRWCRWSELDTTKLVELYKSNSLLWDARHKFYRSTSERNRAYEKILEVLQNPNISVSDIKIKIKNMRSTYHTEHRKMHNFKIEGHDYIPSQSTKIWFTKLKEIMEQVQKNEEEGVEIGSDSDDNQETVIDCIDENEADDGDAYVVSIRQEYLDELENRNQKAMADNSEEFSQPQKKFASTRTYSKPVQECNRGMKFDEFQLFANNMAEQLRTLPLAKALELQVELQTLIAKERIYLYKKNKENNTERIE
ncbi:uncharacterized protein LOC131844731 [Achroia grisella]|uniref:uncharacterized protein LOC131844731 n=1 Tax=Achroia grisella TaxID=688607 RepID=UPI0027D27A02|nr:uncharacterized protein LOC131844731 [Achroia grisella]